MHLSYLSGHDLLSLRSPAKTIVIDYLVLLYTKSVRSVPVAYLTPLAFELATLLR